MSGSGRGPLSAQRSVVAGGLWRAASTLFPMVSALVLSVTISRVLGVEALGLQSLVSYVQALVLNTAVLSLTQAGIQVIASARGAGDTRSLYWLSRWSLMAHAWIGLLITGVMLLVGSVRHDPSGLWVVIALTGLVDAMSYGLTVRIVAREGWTAVSQRRLVSQVLGPLCGLAAVFLGGGITGVFVGQGIGSTFLLVSLLLAARRLPRLTRDGDRIPGGPVVRLWLTFVLSLLLTQIVERRVELLFLEAFSGTRQVAMYSAAFTLVSVAVTACSAVTGAAMPAVAAAFSERGASGVSDLLGPPLRVLAVTSLVLGAGFLALGPSAVLTLYGSAFGDAGQLIRPLALTVLFAPLSGALATYWAGIGALRPLLVAGGVGAVVDIGLCLTLVPALGAPGAVVANLGAGASYAAVLWWRSRGLLGPAFGRPTWLLRSAAVAAVAGAVSALPALVLPPWAAVLLGAAIFAGVLLLLAPRLGLVLDQDRRWLAGLLPGAAGPLVARLAR